MPVLAAVKIAAAPGSRMGGVSEHPRDELVLTLAQLGALVLEQLPPGSPGQHQERDDAGHQKREPAALDQLRHVRGNEDQFDDKEEPVHRRDHERIVTPLQGDEGRQHCRDRHQHRDRDAVCAAERIGRAEREHGRERAAASSQFTTGM